MNIVNALKASGLTGWTWRGNPEIEPSDLSKIEWAGEKPIYTWESLEQALIDKSEEEQIAAQKKSAYDSFISSGFNTGLGFNMAVAKDDQTAMANMMTALKNKAPANDSLWTIKDISGQKHEVTYSQFKDLCGDYFDYCYNAWKAL